MKKFTFKTNKPTGKWKSFYQPSHDIKFNGVVVGHIAPETPFKIRLMVIKDDINSDGNPNCPWKWIQLKQESNSLNEAKVFLNQHIEQIFAKYKIKTED